MRQAILMAIDRDALISSVYQNMATPATGPVMSGTWLYDESAAQDSYDPELSRAILDSLGWRLATDGKRYQPDKPVEGMALYFPILVYDEPGSNVRRNAAEQIAQMLKDVGINASVSIRSYDEVLNNLNSGNFALALCAYNLDVVPDPGFMLLSNAGVNYPGANFSRYNSKDMNTLIRDLRDGCYEANTFRSKMSEILTSIFQRHSVRCALLAHGRVACARSLYGSAGHPRAGTASRRGVLVALKSCFCHFRRACFAVYLRRRPDIISPGQAATAPRPQARMHANSGKQEKRRDIFPKREQRIFLLLPGARRKAALLFCAHAI